MYERTTHLSAATFARSVCHVSPRLHCCGYVCATQHLDRSTYSSVGQLARSTTLHHHTDNNTYVPTLRAYPAIASIDDRSTCQPTTALFIDYSPVTELERTRTRLKCWESCMMRWYVLWLGMCSSFSMSTCSDPLHQRL